MTGGSKTDSFRSARWLTLALAVGWVICFWPARWMQGDVGVQWMSMAAICCLAIGWIVAFLSRLAIFRGSLTQILAQMMGWMFLISGVVLVVKLRIPRLGMADFYGWLIGFYLLSLATKVAVAKSEARQASKADTAGES